jgi:hypothetical protein
MCILWHVLFSEYVLFLYGKLNCGSSKSGIDRVEEGGYSVGKKLWGGGQRVWERKKNVGREK